MRLWKIFLYSLGAEDFITAIPRIKFHKLESHDEHFQFHSNVVEEVLSIVTDISDFSKYMCNNIEESFHEIV